MKTHLLNKIFQENLMYLPRWHGALANHVSMAAFAMYAMKEWVPVDDSEIKRQAKKYMENLTPLRANSSSIDLHQLNWDMQKNLLGYDEYYESWRKFFLQELSDKGIKAVVCIWLTRLGLGMSAAAGHSIIRLSYAFMAEPYLEREVFIEEIATCLGDFASRYFPLSDEIIEVENDLSQTVRLDKYVLDHPALPEEKMSILSSSSLIEDKYYLCRNFLEFNQALTLVNTEIDFECVLKNLSSIAVINPNFALLHCITLAHALLYLYENLPEFNKATLSQGYRDYVIAAILCNNLRVESFETKGATLEQVYTKASGLQNDHSQKIVFSLVGLHKRYSSSLLLEAALSYIQ